MASPSPRASILAYWEKLTTTVFEGALVEGGAAAGVGPSAFSDRAGGSAAGWGGGAEEAGWAEASTPPEKVTTLEASLEGLCATTRPLLGGTVKVGGVSAMTLATPLVLSAASSFSTPTWSMMLWVTVSPRNLSKSMRAKRAFCSAALMSLMFWFNWIS